VAFDPDDAYRLLATWQGGIAEATFPGALEGTFPRPGDSANSGQWPRSLFRGFAPDDAALFVADTAQHPRKQGRALHARPDRLYGRAAAGASRWEPEQVGRGLELLWRSGAAEPRIEVQPTPGAHRLGLVPHFSVAQRWHTARLRSFRPEPYALQPNDEL